MISQLARFICDICFRVLLAGRYIDKRYYLATYPDVAASGQSATTHYLNNGWREGRNPSARFHTLYCASRSLRGGELASNPIRHIQAISAYIFDRKCPGSPGFVTPIEARRAALWDRR
jgi:hypothetical protein